jgi:Putative DNA-binding domain
MKLEEFGDLPPRLEDWTYDTVENLVKKYEFEPGTFDYKDVLNPTGPNQSTYIASIRRTACSMANTGGGFILFGVKDRKVAIAVLKDRIPGMMPYRMLCNDVQREGAKPSLDRASGLFCSVPLHNIRYGIHFGIVWCSCAGCTNLYSDKLLVLPSQRTQSKISYKTYHLHPLNAGSLVSKLVGVSSPITSALLSIIVRRASQALTGAGIQSRLPLK